MTKTKAQLRAEAVERLRNSEYHTALDDICAMLGWGHEPHFEGATDALIDLLTDDCGPCYACAKLAELRAENNALHVEVDRLTRQNISLARDLGECMAERDGLKRENAKLPDDEFYLRCTLVDMDGEVVG